MLKNSLLKQPTEEDPDEGIKDLVEITLKKMASTLPKVVVYLSVLLILVRCSDCKSSESL